MRDDLAESIGRIYRQTSLNPTFGLRFTEWKHKP